MKDLIIVGGGELARVVIDVAMSQSKWRILGFVDPDPCEETTKRMGVVHLGADHVLQNYPDAMCVLGIGALRVSHVCERLVERLGIPDDRWATIVHPSACISTSAKLAHGAIVLPGAVICTGSSIQQHSVISLGAKIDHDVSIGKYVFVSPQAALGGACCVEDSCYIGMGAIIRDHVTVAHHTLVGMGAVVGKQFPASATLVGIPAREMPQAENLNQTA